MKKLVLGLIITTGVFIATAFVVKPAGKPEKEGIKWMTWNQVLEAEKTQHRKVYVDVYTGWCGWCKRMDASTFTDPVIVNYVNDNFYAIKFDAETRESIRFGGKEYKYISQGTQGYNELAAEILNNQMSYPTSVYFDENLEQILTVPGYQDSKFFEAMINFVGTDNYKTVKFEDFQKSFTGKVK